MYKQTPRQWFTATVPYHNKIDKIIRDCAHTTTTTNETVGRCGDCNNEHASSTTAAAETAIVHMSLALKASGETAAGHIALAPIEEKTLLLLVTSE